MVYRSLLFLLLLFLTYGTFAQSTPPGVEPNADPVLHVDNITSCDISADGTIVLTGDRAGILSLWDTDTKKSIRIMDFHLPVVAAMLVDEDRSIFSLHSSSTERNVRVVLRDLSNGKIKRTYNLSSTTNPSSINIDRNVFVDSTYHIDYNESDLILIGNFQEWYTINILADEPPKKLTINQSYLLGHFDARNKEKIIFYYEDGDSGLLKRSVHDLDGRKLEDLEMPAEISVKKYSLENEYRTSVSGLKFFGQVICVPDTATKRWTGEYYFYDLKRDWIDTIQKNEFYHQIRDVKFNADGSQIALATGFVTGKSEASRLGNSHDALGDLVIGIKNVRSQASHLSRMSKKVHHRLGVNRIFWTDQDKMILSVGDDKLILKTNVDNIQGINAHVNPNPGQIFYDVSDDLERIAFTRPGKATGIWNTTDMNATLLEQDDTTNEIVRFLSGDSMYVSAGNDLSTDQIKIWNKQIRNSWNNEHPGLNGFANITFIEPSKINHTIYIAGNYNKWKAPQDEDPPVGSKLVKYNSDSLKSELVIPLTAAQIEQLYLSYDENYIACRPPSTIRTEIYHTTTGKRKKFEKDIWKHTFATDKSYGASIIKGLELKIWNTANDSVFSHTLEEWPDELIFRPGREQILLLYDEGYIHHIDFRTGELIDKTEIEKNFVASPIFSAEGRYLFLQHKEEGNLDARIYDLETDSLLFAPNQHHPPEPEGPYVNRRINCHFGGNGFVLTGDNFGSYQLWDLFGLKLAANLKIVDYDNWIIYTPEGLYDGSEIGRQKMYYTVGTEIVQLDQIMEKYWRPGLMNNILNRVNIPDPKPILLYPQINPDLECNYRFMKGDMSVRDGGIGRLNIYINGIERPGDFNKERKSSFSISFDTLYSYFVPGENIISLQTYDESGLVRSRPVSCTIDFPTSGSRGSSSSDELFEIDTSPSRLHAVIVGTSQYADKDLRLKYPDIDARAMNKMLRSITADVFEDRMHIYELTSRPSNPADSSTKENIIRALDSVRLSAGPNDLFIIFLSGHGEAVEGDFYYKTQKLWDNMSLKDSLIQQKYLLSSREISWYSERIKASKQWLIIDACKSGIAFEREAEPSEDAESSRKKALENYIGQKGIFFLASSESDKNSFESSILKNGLLTFSVLRGLGGGVLGEKGKKGSIEILPLMDYASKETVAISDKLIGPEVKYTQRPQMKTLDESESFEIGIVSDTSTFPAPFDYPYLGVIEFENKNDELTEDTHSVTDSLKSYLKDIGGSFTQDMEFFYWEGGPHRDVFRLTGNYVINQDSITVLLGIKNNNMKVGHIQWIHGKLSDPNDLFARIKKAALIEIKEFRDGILLH